MPKSDDKISHNLPHTSPQAAAEARAQANEYESLFSTTELELDGGDSITIPPPPQYGMLDDERMAEYEELIFELDTEYEREDDIFIPEQRLKDAQTGMETGIVLPPSERRGELKRPYRKIIDGKPVLITPPHSIRVVMAVLGEVEYKRLRDGGRSAKDVWKIWGDRNQKIMEREQRDSKSSGSSVDLAAVPETDS